MALTVSKFISPSSTLTEAESVNLQPSNSSSLCSGFLSVQNEQNR